MHLYRLWFPPFCGMTWFPGTHDLGSRYWGTHPTGYTIWIRTYAAVGEEHFSWRCSCNVMEFSRVIRRCASPNNGSESHPTIYSGTWTLPTRWEAVSTDWQLQKVVLKIHVSSQTHMWHEDVHILFAIGYISKQKTPSLFETMHKDRHTIWWRKWDLCSRILCHVLQCMCDQAHGLSGLPREMVECSAWIIHRMTYPMPTVWEAMLTESSIEIYYCGSKSWRYIYWIPFMHAALRSVKSKGMYFSTSLDYSANICTHGWNSLGVVCVRIQPETVYICMRMSWATCRQMILIWKQLCQKRVWI